MSSGALDGRVALVTGASRGIGKAIALALGNAGARVAVHYAANACAADEVAKAIGNGAATVQCDLSEEASVAPMAARVADLLGRIDILVNNAGIAITKPWAEVDLAD